MNMRDIIAKKRYSEELTDEEIAFFIDGVTKGEIPDYQTSALLMAIVLNGMNDREMTTLTLEMANSCKTNDLSYIGSKAVDKHSTGGVGDKCTPIILPLVASFGIKTVKLLPMISRRSTMPPQNRKGWKHWMRSQRSGRINIHAR